MTSPPSIFLTLLSIKWKFLYLPPILAPVCQKGYVRFVTTCMFVDRRWTRLSTVTSWSRGRGLAQCIMGVFPALWPRWLVEWVHVTGHGRACPINIACGACKFQQLVTRRPKVYVRVKYNLCVWKPNKPGPQVLILGFTYCFRKVDILHLLIFGRNLWFPVRCRCVHYSNKNGLIGKYRLCTKITCWWLQYYAENARILSIWNYIIKGID